jgi:hypothetical protein
MHRDRQFRANADIAGFRDIHANFAMVPKFEESTRKSHRGLAKRLLPASSARNVG